MIIIYIQFGSCTCLPFKCVFLLQLYLSLGPLCCTGLSMLPAWIIFQGSTKKKKKKTTQGKTSALLLGDTFCRRHLRFIIITKINHSKLEHSYDIPSTQTFSGGEGGHGNCLSQSCDSWTRETIFGCLAMFQFLSSGISILLH